jgi:EAL domain-containing protein (putative c-di-GMP-specific phosphodiesterase class I)/GGDEF domain-containing protein
MGSRTAPALRTAKREEARLRVLRDLGLLDTPPGEAFDRITRLASRLFGLPISAISLTDVDRQWFKSRVGVEQQQIPRFKAPCDKVSATGEPVVVSDLLADPTYRDSPLADAGVRFYAGAPLITHEGFALGSMCVLGQEPRTATEAEVSLLRDLAEMVMDQIELRHALRRIDAVSGLPNRTQLVEDMEDLTRDHPKEECMAVLIDLADTHQLADARRVLGPTFLDNLIKFGRTVIQPLLGNDCKIYHVGTTELVFLLREPIRQKLFEMLTEIQSRLADFVESDGVPVSAHAVIGIVPFLLGDTTPRDVLRRAFGAALDAREAEVKVEVHSPAKDEQHHRRFKLLVGIREALIAPNQLSLVYQPRIDVRTGACAGAEALLRWYHPTMGNIPPVEFIPLIEQTALAGELTDWVMNAALWQVTMWRGEGVRVPVSINISGGNLEEEDFVQRLKQGLERHNLPPTAIQLEFTESALIRVRRRVFERLKNIKALGVTCAIDDFGTGYSSFSYLQNIPADIVKIDRSFMAAIDSLERDQILVRAMIDMAHDLKYQVVAEGLETQEAYDFLAEAGCDEVQGYHISSPLTANDFRDWLAAPRTFGSRSAA